MVLKRVQNPWLANPKKDKDAAWVKEPMDLQNEAEEEERQKIKSPTLPACYKHPKVHRTQPERGKSSCSVTFPSFLSHEDRSPGQGNQRRVRKTKLEA